MAVANASVAPKNLTPSVSNNQDKTTSITLIMSVKKPTIVRTNTPHFPPPRTLTGHATKIDFSVLLGKNKSCVAAV